MKFDLIVEIRISTKNKDKTSGKYPKHYLMYYLLPEEIFYACQRIYAYYTYIQSVVFSFQGHYLPSSPNERAKEKERGRMEEGQRRVYIPVWSGVNIPERIDLCG